MTPGVIGSLGGASCELSRSMAYTFDVVGWQDWNNARWVSESDVAREDDRYTYKPLPDDSREVHATWVHVYDPENPEDQTYFWDYTLHRFEDWAEWWTYIMASMSVNYGMELAE